MANLRLQSILKNKVEEIVNSRGHQPSIAFICLMLQEIFDLDEFEAEDAITDMAQDKGIDAIFERDEEGDSILYVVQAKYFIQNCNKTIDENSKNLLVSAISNYILSDYPLDNLNAKLKIKLNEYRERISSGKIDQIVMVFIINGQRPGKNIISELDQFKEEQAGQLVYELYTEEHLASIFSPPSATPVKQIELKIVKDPGSGDKTLLNLPDIGVVHGKVVRIDIHELAEKVKANLNIFNENVRAYQSIRNKVNLKIAETLRDRSLIGQFIYLNNGITLLCDNYNVKPGNECIVIDKPSIINGCQTASTILEVYKEGCIEPNMGFVLARIIKSTEENIKRKIILSSNTQIAIKSRDLISEDDIQKELESQFSTLGYYYERKRGMHRNAPKDKVVDLEKAAQSYMSLYLDKPAEAKNKKGEIYRSYYEQIFNKELTAKQLLFGYSLLMRISNFIKEARKRAPTLKKSILGNSILHLLPLFNEWVLKPQGKLLSEIEDNLSMLDFLFNSNIDIVIKKLYKNIKIIAKAKRGFNPQYFFKSADSLTKILNAGGKSEDYSMTVDLENMRSQKDFRYYKPVKYSLDRSVFHTVKHWNDLLVKLTNQYITKNQIQEGNLDFINSGGRILFLANPNADEKRMRKQLKNGLWVLTNFSSKYLSEFCIAMAKKLDSDLVVELRPTKSRIQKKYKRRKYQKRR